MMPRPLAPLVFLSVALAAGCGGSAEEAVKTGTRTSSSTDATAVIERAARTAIRAHHATSVRVLWTNDARIAARTTAGPAYIALRDAAADRKRRGVRVRLISERFRIVSLRVDPGFARATAVVSSTQRVQPSQLDGRPLGKSVELRERARLELRRVDRSTRFVVWKVGLLA